MIISLKFLIYNNALGLISLLGIRTECSGLLLDVFWLVKIFTFFVVFFVVCKRGISLEWSVISVQSIGKFLFYQFYSYSFLPCGFS